MTKILKSADLHVIQSAIAFKIKSLEELHMRGAAMGATEPFYKNIRTEIQKYMDADRAICELFESQYTKTP